MSLSLRESLSINLKEIRLLRQLSLTEFANEAGIGRSTLCGLETGRSNTTLETVDHMAARLDIPASSLLCGKELCDQCAVGVVLLNDQALSRFAPEEKKELFLCLRIIRKHLRIEG